MKVAVALAFAAAFFVECSGSPRTNGPQDPPSEDLAIIRNCQFLDSRDATVDLAFEDQGLSPALTWQNFRSVSAVNSEGETEEVGASYSRPQDSPDSIRFRLHLNDRPTRLVITALVATSGPKTRAEGKDVDDLIGAQGDFGSVTGTIDELRTSDDGIILAMSFNTDPLAVKQGWRFVGLDDVRIRQGGQQWVTQLTYSEPQEDGQLIQYVGLASLGPTELDVKGQTILTTGGLALQRIGATTVAWPQECRPQ
jgi:hypothetical protein